jgi:hypothetical protein
MTSPAMIEAFVFKRVEFCAISTALAFACINVVPQCLHYKATATPSVKRTTRLVFPANLIIFPPFVLDKDGEAF